MSQTVAFIVYISRVMIDSSLHSRVQCLTVFIRLLFSLPKLAKPPGFIRYHSREPISKLRVFSMLNFPNLIHNQGPKPSPTHLLRICSVNTLNINEYVLFQIILPKAPFQTPAVSSF